jgi:hypothetical protein
MIKDETLMGDMMKDGWGDPLVKKSPDQELKITEQCKAEIQAILDKYSCHISVSTIIKPAGNIPQIAIVRNR